MTDDPSRAGVAARESVIGNERVARRDQRATAKLWQVISHSSISAICMVCGVQFVYFRIIFRVFVVLYI